MTGAESLCLTFWSRSTAREDPFLRVVLMGFLWLPQVACPSFFFFFTKTDVCCLLQFLGMEARALGMSSRHSACHGLHPQLFR